MGTVVRRCKCRSAAEREHCLCDRSEVKWRARHGQGRSEVSRTFPSEREARTWLATVVADQARGTYVDHRDGRRLLRDWAVEWQQAQLHARNTRASVDWALNVHILPVFGDRPIAKVTRVQVQAWIRSLEQQGYAPSTIATLHKYLSMLMLAATLENPPLIAGSPCVRIRLPQTATTERPWIDEHQLLQLASDDKLKHHAPLIVTAFYTGMRLSELLGLRLLPDDVDLLRSRLRILDPGREPGSFGPLKEVGGKPAHGRPKTGSSRRDVSLPPFLVALLAEHMADGRREDCPGCGTPHLFTSAWGKPMRRSYFSAQVWNPAVERLFGNGLHFHDLRSSHKTVLQNERIPDFAIDKRLGHARSDVKDRYSRLSGEVERDLLAGLQRRWDGAKEKRRAG